MSSSGSSSDAGKIVRMKGRGIPKSCICGESTVMRTSRIDENPGRLFHCCPYRTKMDKSHLFKWTDESLVEEIEEFEDVVKKLKWNVGGLEKDLKACESEIGTLEGETRTCEAVVNSYERGMEAIKTNVQECEKEIEEIKIVVSSCEKKIEDCVRELRSLKNVIVCGLMMVLLYYMFA